MSKHWDEDSVRDLVDCTSVNLAGQISWTRSCHAAEANILGDPEAADFVCGQTERIRLIGLDVTHRCRVPVARLDVLASSSGRFGPFLFQALEFYLKYHRSALQWAHMCRWLKTRQCPISTWQTTENISDYKIASFELIAAVWELKISKKKHLPIDALDLRCRDALCRDYGQLQARMSGVQHL